MAYIPIDTVRFSVRSWKYKNPFHSSLQLVTALFRPHLPTDQHACSCILHWISQSEYYTNLRLLSRPWVSEKALVHSGLYFLYRLNHFPSL